MRWVPRRKRETNREEIDRVLAATGERPIVEVSTRDTFWRARPAGDHYEGRNALGRLWMELRRQLREDDPQSRSSAWIDRIRVGRLAGRSFPVSCTPSTLGPRPDPTRGPRRDARAPSGVRGLPGPGEAPDGGGLRMPHAADWRLRINAEVEAEA